MAGLRGNQAWFMLQKQTARGAAAVPALPAAAVPGAYKSPFTGGNIGPVREMDNLSETDNSRDRGVAYVSTSGVEGSPELYVRDRSIGQLLHGALGASAVTGTAPDYTHIITPGATLPYFTAWRNISNTLFEQYRDCKIGTLTISAEAGAPLTASVGLQGLQASRLAADPSVTPEIPLQSSDVYSFNDATITLGGGATAMVRSFELTIENSLTRQQTDDVVPIDVVEGTREVNLGFDLLFESLDEYNKFHYGSAAGTAISSTVYETSAAFVFAKGTENEIGFNLPHIAYQEFPIEPNAGGDPVVASVRAVAQRHPTDPVLTATIKNQVSLY